MYILYVHKYVCMYTCTVYKDVCAHICMYVCMYVYVHSYACRYMCNVHMYVHNEAHLLFWLLLTKFPNYRILVPISTKAENQQVTNLNYSHATTGVGNHIFSSDNHTHVCKHPSMYTCAYMHVCMYAHTYIRTYICMYVCMYVRPFKKISAHFPKCRHALEAHYEEMGKSIQPHAIQPYDLISVKFTGIVCMMCANTQT